MNRLSKRVEALEQLSGDGMLPAIWIHAKAGETKEEARARHEAESGPIGNRFVVMWRPKQCA